MSIVIAADGEAYWSKPVDLGFMGKFDEIIIDLDRCEAAGVIEGMSQMDILDKATVYYEDRFKNLEANADKLGEQFLMWIITHLCDIGYPFWQFDDNTFSNGEYPDYINKEVIKKFEDESGALKTGSNGSSPIYEQLYAYDPYTNCDQLTSFQIVAQYLPVLNFEKLIATIHPDLLNTSDEYINFQVSSEVCGGLLLCATYGIIYENNELEVTNNC